MSFYCPHYTDEDAGCRRLRRECRPGQPGCVLHGHARVPSADEIDRPPAPTPAADTSAAAPAGESSG